MELSLGLACETKLAHKLRLCFQKTCPKCNYTNNISDWLKRFNHSIDGSMSRAMGMEPIPICGRCGEPLWTYRGAMYNTIRRSWQADAAAANTTR
jgi:hypothetical protein